jgi:hypothetical protein
VPVKYPVSAGIVHLLMIVSAPAVVGVPGSQIVETHSVGSMVPTTSAGSVQSLTTDWTPTVSCAPLTHAADTYLPAGVNASQLANWVSCGALV